MSQAVDYSTARPDPATLAQRFAGALRYLAPLPNKKVVDRPEIDALHAAGLAVGFVWESVASRAAQGYTAGVTDAQQANGLADNLGVPGSVTIYYAVDFDANPDTIVGYFQGVQSIGRRPVGGYGSFSVIERLLDDGLIARAWQTVAWSRNQRSARAVLFQRADAAANPPPGCDVNDILQDDWGQWPAQGEAIDMTDDQNAKLLDIWYFIAQMKEAGWPNQQTFATNIRAIVHDEVAKLASGSSPNATVPVTGTLKIG